MRAQAWTLSFDSRTSILDHRISDYHCRILRVRRGTDVAFRGPGAIDVGRIELLEHALARCPAIVTVITANAANAVDE